MALNNLELMRKNTDLRMEIAALKQHIGVLDERLRISEARADKEFRRSQHGLFIRIIAERLKVPQDEIMDWIEQMWRNYAAEIRQGR